MKFSETARPYLSISFSQRLFFSAGIREGAAAVYYVPGVYCGEKEGAKEGTRTWFFSE